MSKVASKTDTIQVPEITTQTIRLALIGRTPLIMNRMTAKVRQELLLPGLKLKSAERINRLKHDPIAEFRDSAGRDRDPNGPTEIVMPSTAFKAALRNAALDSPGVAKSQIGRLTYVEGETVSIYGAPKVFCQAVRSSGMNAAPDIRTRALIPQWACLVDFTYATPLIQEGTLINLLRLAGLTIGVGDFRPQKGQGTYGQFMLADPQSDEFIAIVAAGGRQAQLKAFQDAEAYDIDSAELLDWFKDAASQRGLKAVA